MDAVEQPPAVGLPLGEDPLNDRSHVHPEVAPASIVLPLMQGSTSPSK